jgi:hypothetical protein
VESTFECATKTVYSELNAGVEQSMRVVLLPVALGELLWSRLTHADFHVGVGISRLALPIGLAQCVGESQPSANIVLGDDQPAGLDRIAALFRQGLQNIGLWPAIFAERLPRKRTSTGLTGSQKLRLVEHCKALPAESHTTFTLVWMNESALQVHCTDVMAAADRLLDRTDLVPDADVSGRPRRFMTHWREDWGPFADGHLYRALHTGLHSYNGNPNSGASVRRNITKDIDQPEIVEELSRHGKGFLPGLSEDPLDVGHVLSKVSCCTDDGSLRWHTATMPSVVPTSTAPPVYCEALCAMRQPKKA